LLLTMQNGHLAQVKVDKMLCLVSDVAAKVPPNDAVPGWVVLLVKLLKNTDKRKGLLAIIFNAKNTIHCVLLHVLRHVRVLDHCFSVSHGSGCLCGWGWGPYTPGPNPPYFQRRKPLCAAALIASMKTFTWTLCFYVTSSPNCGISFAYICCET
uniref:Uncharacterized protein n=1 Tax=Cyprinodon variegatus TaxID=28743 RepID=A0A3Q2GNE4_CYPVA